MTTSSHIHWAAPTTTILSLALGIIFSISHHIFYHLLDGTPTPNNDYNFYITKVSPQQLNIAVGTALAFLVNATLVATMSTAYVQLFWRSMIYRAQDVTLDALDCTFSAFTDVFALFKIKVWYRHPLLFLIACICWLLPIASVVTPGTLSVESKPMLPAPTSLTRVPTAGFDSLNFLSDMQSFGSPLYFTSDSTTQYQGVYVYQGPSRPIENVALDVATNGEIQRFSPPNVNATWSLDFPGPAIQCSNIQGSDRQALIQNVAYAMKNTNQTMYTFLAWGYSWNRTAQILVTNETTTGPMLPFAGMNLNREYINPGSTVPATLYVSALPGAAYTTGWLQNSTFARCELINTTYHTEFSFVNGKQTIHPTRQVVTDQPVSAVGAVAGPGYSTSQGESCFGKTDVLHKINDAPCSFRHILARNLSYQAIFDAFSQLLLGSVTWNGYMNPVIDTNVINTILIDSPEMSFVKQMHQRNLKTLQGSLLESNSSVVKGFVNKPSPSTGRPLAEAMESLFEKIVISSMSSAELQSNPESPFAPPPTKVTFHSYHNEYVYSPTKLWTAYGIAIFVATLISIIGVVTIFANGASHSSDFSSVFRFAWGASISEPVRDEDTSGRDPLPEYLAAAKVTFVTGGEKQHHTKAESSPIDVPRLPSFAERGRRSRTIMTV